ncbi:hypothetical protein SETIT_5G367400v2 [Setaria italica]|uniref:Uncharacterized protein n=1 Tax=Setaria italica TaxID=4555 RepID=K3XQW5_SETIT|nr:uncharacterized protein LOC101756785 [Setaria italica]RCV27961.1 hypothetical protein SETIT_5G367400v2 [Setaria italica]
MDPIITKRATERERNADGQPPPPLLDSPLPTPRRSWASVDASRPRCRRDSSPSPLRTHVPFSWESSPGVPKNSACGRDVHKKALAATMPPPPRPPPGRPQPPCLALNSYYGNTSEASTDDDDDDRSFSEALDRISSPERTGSFDRVTSKRFEDIFVGRATSFSKDRSRHPAAEATEFSASGRHPRRVSTRSSHDEDRRWTPRLLNDSVPMQLMQRIRMDAEAEEMTPRACGLMVFFPWSAKPAVCGFRGCPTPVPAPAAQHATPRPGADAPSPRSRSRSHSRRITTTTLRDVIKEDNEKAISGDSSLPRGEKKRIREDLQSRRWGVSSLLDTSKKYCTDARKALSKLSIGLGADSGSPRVSGERRSGKLHDGFSSTPATPAKLTQLKANRN